MNNENDEAVRILEDHMVELMGEDASDPVIPALSIAINAVRSRAPADPAQIEAVRVAGLKAAGVEVCDCRCEGCGRVTCSGAKTRMAELVARVERLERNVREEVADV